MPTSLATCFVEYVAIALNTLAYIWHRRARTKERVVQNHETFFRHRLLCGINLQALLSPEKYALHNTSDKL
jgi:hypothetical protein